MGAQEVSALHGRARVSLVRRFISVWTALPVPYSRLSFRNCDTFIYFGLSLYSTHFAGDIYMNYFLVGLVEVPAYILSPIAMNRKVLFSNRPIIEVDGYAAFITRSEPGN